jgi:hypothetical protein
MLGWEVAGFAAIQAIALNVAINGSILADPEACSVTKRTERSVMSALGGNAADMLYPAFIAF